MELKELEKLRNKSQKVTNNTGADFTFKWDGVEYTIEKGATESYPFYLAEHAAIHMARKVDVENFHRTGEKRVNEALGKEHIEYDSLTIRDAKEIAKERGIPLVTEEGKNKNRATLIEDLKKTH